MASILFFDLAFVLFFGLIVYLLVRTLKYSGIILSAVFYTLLIVFSTVSTITYLRLGAPINISMVPEMKFDFLKSSIEQTADIRLLLIKIVLLIVFGLLLPYLINVISKRFLGTFTLSVIISTAVCFALFLTTYVQANKLGEPDLWKTPVQSFFYPIWSELGFEFYLENNENAFSFESPFKDYKQIEIPKIDIPNKRSNVLIYMMEGIPLRLMMQVINDGNMPELQKIINSSIYFQHYYPAYADSTKGVFSTITSMYPYPGYKKLIKSNTKLECQSLPRILNKEGYRTVVISSGSFESSRGLDDRFILDQFDRILDHTNGPFFILMIPTNSHHPYFTPDLKFKLYLEKQPNARLKNSICYQDHIIGKILDILTKHGVAGKTITIITSDHSIRYDYDKGKKKGNPQVSPGEDQHAIPFILQHQAIKSPSTSAVIASHVDIPPTVLNLLGFAGDEQFQGIDLFSNHDGGRIHYIVSTIKNFNITLRDSEYQYYYDLSNNIEAIRFKDLLSGRKEYSSDQFPERASAYKQLCTQFVHFQRKVLEMVNNIPEH